VLITKKRNGKNAMQLRKRFYIFAFQVLLACLFSNFLVVLVSGQPVLPVQNVNTGYSYATIQEAIDDIFTLNGHAIRVSAGTYYEHISLHKSLLLLGENPESTIIDGEGNGTVIEISVANVTVAGFTIRNSGSVSGSAGIRVYQSSFCNLSENNVQGNWYGIWLESCVSPSVSYNNFTHNQNAVYVDSSEGGAISMNSFSNNSFAVWLSGAETLDFQLNDLFGNDYGIWVTQSVDLSINGNSILDNVDGILVYNNSDTINLTGNIISSNADYAIFLNECTNSSVSGNHVSSRGKEAIYIQNSRNNSLTDNEVSGNGYDGINLYQSDSNTVSLNIVTESKSGIGVYSSVDNVISENNLFGNEQGIVLSGSQMSEVFGNTITENNYGVQVTNSRNVKIETNNISRNVNDGIRLSTSLYTELFNNSVSGNGNGIRFTNSSGNLITSNRIDDCEDGLWVEESRNNTFSKNDLSFNSDCGFVLSNSVNNTFSNNNLLNNTVGIRLDRLSELNSISDNSISKGAQGVYIEQSNRNSFMRNKIFENGDGFVLNVSDRNIIHENTIEANTEGIRILNSNNNDLELNDVFSSLGRSIHVSNSSFNIFLHNNVLNNTLKPDSFNSSNTWDNGIEGNFWGYEDLVDDDRDGIADSPFVLSDTDRDGFPLMGLYAQVNVWMENQEFVLGIVCNSSVLDFRYFREPLNATSLITFRVSEFEGLGFCRISLPRALIQPPFEITADNAAPLFQQMISSNLTYSWVYFSFPYIGGNVRIVPAAPAPPFWAEFWFWGIVALAVIIVALALAIFFFYRRLGSYRETIEEFEKKLEEKESSPMEVARRLFSADVKERGARISRFEEKYGVKIRPRNSLEDVFKRLKRRKDDEKDEVNS
jgi:parallel beta-helix repeat protein